jgi:hypothetical protein
MTYGHSILDDLWLAEEAGMVFPEADVVLEGVTTANDRDDMEPQGPGVRAAGGPAELQGI